uniref:H15 domain-containing protein n=3 Tax=Nymphaea colorata TaxID=210225 RepID=A0A5K1AEP0_9MAGN
MIKEAITALHEKSGSSAHAIAKYMESKHKAVLPENYKKKLALQLKNAAAKGKLVKVKASFKLAEAPKKKPATAPAKRLTKPVAAAKPKKTTTKKQAPAASAKPAKKPPAKKAPKKKAAAPKPKSIKTAKSPAPKKAKKAA